VRRKTSTIFVEPTKTNARRVCAALADFGFLALSRQAAEFARPDRVATLGRPPLRIDVMTSIEEVEPPVRRVRNSAKKKR